MNPSTERPRRVELVENGLVEDSGRVRQTDSKTEAVVWIVVAPYRKDRTVAVPAKPTPAQIRTALSEIIGLYEALDRKPGEDMLKLGRWLRYQANKTKA